MVGRITYRRDSKKVTLIKWYKELVESNVHQSPDGTRPVEEYVSAVSNKKEIYTERTPILLLFHQ